MGRGDGCPENREMVPTGPLFPIPTAIARMAGTLHHNRMTEGTRQNASAVRFRGRKPGPILAPGQGQMPVGVGE